MKYFLLLILCFLSLHASLNAQSECYKNLRKEGLTLLQKKNYRSAVDKFFAARYCPDKPTKDDLDDLIKKTQDQWVAALAQAQKKTVAALAKADSALNLANNIIDAFYFYKDSFALAYKAGAYGFINKKGEAVIDYQYDAALPFDDPGYAQVNKDNVTYLIDTKGVEYQLATELNQLDTHIVALDLRHKKLDTLPMVILENPQLKILLLSSNGFTRLPEELGKLKNLQTLDLVANQLTSLPESMGQLSNLQILYLYHNQLTSLPESIGQLSNLKDLDLKGNQLISLPESISKLSNLQNLYLSVIQLKSLPESIGKLSNLQTLDLSGNQLTSLPAELKNLRNLQTLYLNSNKLINLPVWLKDLKRLQRLDLKFNLFSIQELQKLPLQFYNDQLLDFGLTFIRERKYQEALPYYQALSLKLLSKDSRRDLVIWKCKDLTYYLIAGKEFKLALDAALLVQQLEATDDHLYSFLPLTYLLNDQFEKAKAIYIKYKDKNIISTDEGQNYKSIFLKDLTMLESDGITHPDIAKIRALLKE